MVLQVEIHAECSHIKRKDMANGKQSESRAADIIKNWIRTRYTIEFLGTWEMIHNPNFKVVEFDHFRMLAGLPNFVMSVSEWIEKTNVTRCLTLCDAHAVATTAENGEDGPYNLAVLIAYQLTAKS